MTFFTASLKTVLLRYYLMMAVIIASFLVGLPILALLAFPIFISAIAAISFKKEPKKASQRSNTKNAEEITMINTAA